MSALQDMMDVMLQAIKDYNRARRQRQIQDRLKANDAVQNPGMSSLTETYIAKEGVNYKSKKEKKVTPQQLPSKKEEQKTEQEQAGEYYIDESGFLTKQKPKK